jgi:hypothetical protein
MLTMAVFAICITAPLGAIFINTLGPKWLSQDLPAAKVDGDSVSAAPSLTDVSPQVAPEAESAPISSAADAEKVE